MIHRKPAVDGVASRGLAGGLGTRSEIGVIGLCPIRVPDGGSGHWVEGQISTLASPVATDVSTLSSVAMARINFPRLSSVYMRRETDICLKLLRHEILFPVSFALPSAGNKMDARMTMMVITTSNSSSVKAAGINFPAGGRDD